MKWFIQSTDYLLCTKWLTVRKDKVRMPSGVVIDDYYVLEYPDWINVIAITKEGLFIIEQQYRHGTQSVDYEICAGACCKDEDPLAAAQRELLEETGFGGGEWTLFNISCPNPSAMTNRTYSFLAKNVERVSQPQPENTEDIEVMLMPFGELEKLLQEGRISQGQMQAALWKYIAKYPIE